eukprot:12966194-Alexandrium_andersonii.AAC.1
MLHCVLVASLGLERTHQSFYEAQQICCRCSNRTFWHMDVQSVRSSHNVSHASLPAPCFRP